MSGPTAFRVLVDDVTQITGVPWIVSYRLDPQTLAVTEISGDAVELLGFPPEAWCHPHFFTEKMHPDDRAAAHDFCRAFQGDRRSQELQYRLIDAAGRVRWVHEIIRVRDGGENGIEIRGVLVDITGRVAAERNLRKALRLREEIQRIVAEELAQPVRTIGSFCDLLGRHLSAQQDDVGSDYALGIRESIQRLDTLAAGLLRQANAGAAGVEEIGDGLDDLGVLEPYVI